MSDFDQREIETQRDVLRFFKEELGYDNLGNWHDRELAKKPASCLEYMLVQ